MTREKVKRETHYKSCKRETQNSMNQKEVLLRQEFKTPNF